MATSYYFTIVVTILPLGALVRFADIPKLVQRKKAYCYCLETAASVCNQKLPWLETVE